MAFLLDGLKNLVANLGTSRDKAYATTYAQPATNYNELVAAYRTSWLAKKIVDIPPLDAVRSWREWQAEADHITAIEAEEDRLQLRTKLRQAQKAARLYGGAAIYIGTDDPDLMEPLAPDRVSRGGLRYLNVLTPRTLSGGEIDHDPTSEWYGRPKFWRVTWGDGQALQIHPSRLVLLTGADLPPDDPLMASGWGDSVLTASMDAIKAADATMANIASLVFEAKIDVVRVPDMMERLSEQGYSDKLQQRFTLAALAKGNNGTLILDKDEEYDQKTYAFSTLPDIADRFFQAVSGAADIPMTRLLGMSPSGLNSTGESDIRNYYDSIKASQELELRPAMYRLDESLIRSALGNRPPAIHYQWASLWQISESEKADIGQKTAMTIKTLYDTGIYLPEVLAQIAANSLVEDGIFPGMEDIIKEQGMPDSDMLGLPGGSA